MWYNLGIIPSSDGKPELGIDERKKIKPAIKIAIKKDILLWISSQFAIILHIRNA